MRADFFCIANGDAALPHPERAPFLGAQLKDARCGMRPL
jgi:hypothetical protein